MGIVYKAADLSLGGRPVAVKEMSERDFRAKEYDPRVKKAYEEAVQTFKSEALMLANLSHHNLPQIYAHFEEHDYWYLVMEFIEGETLTSHLNKAKGGHLSIEEVLHVGIQLCTVLHYLHTHEPGIIFRDLKPDNIMLTEEGHIYLIDFGIARHFKTGKTIDARVIFSRGYAPPEQYWGQTTPRSDIFSLGVTLHQLLSGHYPRSNIPPSFYLSPLQASGWVIPVELERLVIQMIARDENQRPTDMATIKKKLEGIKIQGSAGQTSTDPSQVIPPPSVPPPAMEPMWELQMSHAAPVWSVAWSRDGTRLASGSEDKTVQVWDSSTGQSLMIYRGHSSAEVRAVAWSPDGTRIASGGWDKKVHVWEVATGKKSFIYHHHTDYVRTLAWSTDGAFLASAENKTVHIWNATSGSTICMYSAHDNAISGVTWSPDGAYLASASLDGTVQVWNVTTRSLSFTYRHEKSVYGVAWSPDGNSIASCGEDKTVQIWDATTGHRMFNPCSGHTNWVYAVAWTSDSKRLASASRDRTLRVWNATTGASITTYPCQTDQVLAVAWSPDGKRIAYSDSKIVQVKRVE